MHILANMHFMLFCKSACKQSMTMCFLLIKVIKTTKVVLMHLFVTHLSLFNSQSCGCLSL